MRIPTLFPLTSEGKPARALHVRRIPPSIAEKTRGLEGVGVGAPSPIAA